MKKLFFISMLSLCVFSAGAQLLVSGQLSIRNTNRLETLSTLNISPRIGYNWGNWWMGIDADYTKIKFLDQGDFTSQSIGVFARNTKKINSLVGIWLESTIHFTYAESNGSFNNINYTFTSKGAATVVRPGVIFFLGRHLSLETSIGRVYYSRGLIKQQVNSGGLVNAYMNQAGITVGDGLQFGVNWLF